MREGEGVDAGAGMVEGVEAGQMPPATQQGKPRAMRQRTTRAGPSTDVGAEGNSGPDRKSVAGRGDLAMSPGDEPIPLAEYARTRRVGVPAVHRAIAAGKLGDAVTFNARGHRLIRPLAADRAWGKAPAVNAPAAPVKPAEVDEAVRIRRERDAFALERDRFEFGVRRGEYVRADDVRTEITRIATEARNAMMQIADRIAPRVAAENDARICHSLIADEVRRVLTTLADDLAKV